MSRQLRNSLLLVLTALIWGVAFVAQSAGGAAAGPFTFNCIRSLIGCVVLLPVVKILHRGKGKRSPEYKRTLFRGGVCCGVLLFLASSLQQLGITMGTAAGKAGFLTATYILMVPILGIFLKKRCPPVVWAGVAITLVGLYLLCMDGGSFSLTLPDLLLLGCALGFSFQIMAVDHFSPLVAGAELSCVQFLTCGILGIFPTVFCEMGIFSGGLADWAAPLTTTDAWIPILYAGVLSCGVAYTLQIIGQKGLNPAIASLLMSLESVFSVLAGWVLLHESLSARELIGCALIFAAIVLAQLPERNPKGESA